MNAPNIIWINYDHYAEYQLSHYFPTIKRPHYDRVCNEGTSFSNAYCPAPLCGPARRSLITGLYPHSHGQTHNETDHPYDTEVYLDTLRQAGYQSFYYGKWHAGAGTALEHSCSGFSSYGYGNPYTSPEYKEYLIKRELPAATHVIQQFYEWDNKETMAYKDSVDNKSTLKRGDRYQSTDPNHCCISAAGLTTTPEDTHECYFLTNLACEKLEEIVQSGSTTPFSIRVDFWGPHYPYFPTKQFLDMYEGIRFPQYPSFDSQLTGKPNVYSTERHYPMGKGGKICYPNPLEWEIYEEMLRYCAAQLTMFDDATGRLLSKIDELGLRDNTLLIISADHGDGLGCHGGHFDKGSYLSQEVLKIPVVLRWPNHIPAAKKITSPINSLSIPVTILNSIGVPYSQNPVHGFDLIDQIQNSSFPTYTVSETYGQGYGEVVVSRALITEQYKLVVSETGESELYDLISDPYELHNLINDEAFKDVSISLYQLFLDWQQKTLDPMQFSL